LANRLGVDAKEIEAIVGDYPMRITPTVMATIKEKGDAIWKQVVPDIAEMDDFEAEDDPLEEDLMSPVPHLVHRYPDRVLLMVTNQCPIYCRFCTRKRLVGKPGFLKKGELDQAIAYLRKHTEVRDVILSGSGEFLARHALELPPAWNVPIRSLAEKLGPGCSAAACAHALTVLAAQRELA
jgi:lysine 2,3-aminomutase